MQELKDKVAIVVGAARGNGRGLAERCAEDGMKLEQADTDGVHFGYCCMILVAGQRAG